MGHVDLKDLSKSEKKQINKLLLKHAVNGMLNGALNTLLWCLMNFVNILGVVLCGGTPIISGIFSCAISIFIFYRVSSQYRIDRDILNQETQKVIQKK